MAKVLDPIEYQSPRERRVGSVSKIVVLAVLGFVLVPILIEGVAVCAAQWAEILGIRFVVKTPLLSWSGTKLEDCRQLMGEWMSDSFRDSSWEPGFAFPILAALIIIAMLMLRR